MREESGVVGAISWGMLRKRESPLQESGGNRGERKYNKEESFFDH